MNERTIYWTILGVIGALLIVALISWDYSGPDDEALAKAEELIAAVEAEGRTSPLDAEQVASVLGTDGGIVCQGAGAAHQRGYILAHLAVGGEFYVRPVIVNPRTVAGLRLVVDTYCPEKASDVAALIDSLRFAE